MPDQSPSSEKIHDRLNAARGLSAIAVLLDHSHDILVARVSGRDLISYGASVFGTYAVVIFFLLSGHLITRSLVLNVTRNGGRLDLEEYVVSRLTRIYPPLIGAIVLCALLWLVIRTFRMPGVLMPFGFSTDPYAVRTYYTFSVGEIVSALTLQGGMLQVNGPLWTLYIECQMYVVAAAIFLACKGSRLSALCGLLLALTLCGELWNQPLMVAIWFLGSATALIPARKWWLYGSFVGGVLLFAIEARHRHLDGVLQEATMPLAMLASSMMLAYFLFFSRVRFRPTRAMLETASYSYSLYIIHFPILLFVLSATQSWVGSSISKAWTILALCLVPITALARAFAAVAEHQIFYKRLLRSSSETQKDPPQP